MNNTQTLTAQDLSEKQQKALQRAERVSFLFDLSFRVPIIGVRVGLDGLLGLIPVVGDIASGVAAAYIIGQAHKAGAGRGTLINMAFVGLLDMLIGSVPLIGDIADFFFKGHRMLARMLSDDLRRRV